MRRSLNRLNLRFPSVSSPYRSTLEIRWSFMRGTCPAHLACAFSKRASVDAGHVCSGEHLYFGDLFLSFVFYQLAGTGCVEVVQLSGIVQNSQA